MGRKPKILTDEEPKDKELKAAERYAKKLEERWKSDIEDIRKTLRGDADDEEDFE